MFDFSEKKLADGVSFLKIYSENCKKNRISVTMLTPLRKESVSANAVLPYVLKRACREYPDFSSLEEKLALLYGADLEANVMKIGDNQCLTLSVSALDDRFTFDGEPLAQECASLLFSMVFDPVMENGMLRKCDVDAEKRILAARIEAESNNKRRYARQRCEELMCRDEYYGIDPLGSAETVEGLTECDVTEAWQNILRSAFIVISATGFSAKSDIEETAAGYLVKVQRDYRELPNTQTDLCAESIQRITERLDVVQAKLVMGFRVTGRLENDDIDALRLMSALFGGTPNSKLFVNVREKMSLCYYCASVFNRKKQLLIVDCGLEEKNSEKAEKEILSQLDAVKNGNFSDEELENAKRSIINDFKSYESSLSAIEAFYMTQASDGCYRTPIETAESIKNITADDVKKAAQRLVPDTFFLLAGKEAQHEI